MSVRVEPPRERPGQRYPGLTPEERGLAPADEPAPVAASDPEPPLWILPSELPAAARATGFVGALPEPSLPEPLPPEGLFDVPGLLERLWLARALEAAHHARPQAVAAEPPSSFSPRPAVPSPSQSGAVTPGALGAVPAPTVPPPASLPLTEARAPEPEMTPRAYLEAARPRGWICPHCYLTNDAAATTCRGCKSGTLHL